IFSDGELPAVMDHVVQHLPEKILPAHIAHLLGCRIELDRQLSSTIKFYTAPKQMGDVRRQDFLWQMLNDMIHHRGQLSVYLRMAGGKVPSIYGPSKDEPWQ